MGENQGVFIMNKIPNGITVIYFDDKEKNIYAKLPPDKEQAKKLSKRIYKTAMTALASREPLNPNSRLFAVQFVVR